MKNVIKKINDWLFPEQDERNSYVRYSKVNNCNLCKEQNTVETFDLHENQNVNCDCQFKQFITFPIPY